MNIREITERLLGEMYAENQKMELRAEGVKLLYERLIEEQRKEQSSSSSGEETGDSQQPDS